MSWPLSFVLGHESIEVHLGPFIVRSVRYDDIEAVDVGSAWVNEHWLNVWPWRYVTIRRKAGWIRNFTINPPDRESFIAELKRRASLP